MEMTGYVYLCSAGETFDSVALTMYEDEKYAAELLCANPEESHKAVFEGGEVLRLPEIEIPIINNDEVSVTAGKAPWKE